MALPITINYTFGSATTAIPLGNLDTNFTTVVNAINGIGNGTNSLSNVSITGGTITATGQITASASGVRFSDGTTLTSASAITPVSAVNSFSNLKVNSTAGTANTTVTASEIVLENSSNAYATVRSVSVTINSTVVGVANGLDSGAVAANTWYSIWVIFNPTTVTTAGLMSTSATAPTLPSGYTFKARVGWIKTRPFAANQNLGIIQYGRRAQYIVDGTVLTQMPTVTSGSTSSAWTAAAWADYAPSTAGSLTLVLSSNSGSTALAAVAPNGNYPTSGNAAPLVVRSNSGYASVQGAIVPESANIYYWSNAGQNTVYANGWEDNL